MANPAVMGGIGLAATAIGGITSAAGAETAAQGKQLDIQGAILKTMGQAFGLRVQANQYGYQANVEDYQAGVAEVNRQIALQNASYALDVGEVSASQEGLKSRAALSSAKVAQGASGLDINTGSAVNVRESMVELGQYNQAVIRANAAKVAYNYNVEATQDAAQRDLHLYAEGEDKAQAADSLKAAGMTEQAIPLEQQAFALAGKAGDISAFGSIVGAAGSVASKWSSAKTTGLFGDTSAS
jgi:hypothetical protein